MTLKTKSGKLSASKVTLCCTVVVAFSALVAVMPQLAAYTEKAISPWTSLPDKMAEHDRQLRLIVQQQYAQYDLTRQIASKVGVEVPDMEPGQYLDLTNAAAREQSRAVDRAGHHGG